MAPSGIQSRLEQEKQVPPQFQPSPGFGAWLNSMGGISTYQRSCPLWVTGLSGPGKSTVAGLMEQDLAAQGMHS